MDETNRNINVEKIMEEIREQICREEGMAEISLFDDIPAREKNPAGPPVESQAEAERERDWPLLLSSLQYVNNGYDIPYYWSFGPHSPKTFAKRVVRKLLKCLIAPILAMQNAFNAHVVRCLNQLRYFVESILNQVESNKQELDKLRQRSLHHDQELREMERRFREQEERLSALATQQFEEFQRADQEMHAWEQMLLGQIDAREESLQQALEEIRNRLQQEVAAVSEKIHEYNETAKLQEKIQRVSDELEQEISAEIERIDLQYQSVRSALETETAHIVRWQDDRDRKLQSMARDVIHTKWAFTDYMEGLHNTENEIVQCGICGYSGAAVKLEKKITKCVFGGGELVRYVCPDCGAIFGPTKFSKLGQEVRDDDYTVHYTGYHEGDSTEKEVKTFMRLEPTKHGVYLNYGCGSWSQTMQRLHDLGYCVYGFEPYSHNIDNPYIISDRSELSKMRFSGIFSNDLLEHLADPIEELRFMKTLLATPDALMAHTTGCYEYKYEYTRFHMFFFTGRSLNVVCDRAGLNLIEVSDLESEIGEKDFHCRIFGRKEQEIDYLPMACVNTFAEVSASKICLLPEGICYGPYIMLPAGKYKMEVSAEFPSNIRSVHLKVTSQRGEKVVSTIRLLNGDNQVEFTLDDAEDNVEFVIENMSENNIILKKLALVQ